MGKLIFFLFFYFINTCSLFSQIQGIILDIEKNPINQVNVFLVDQKILLYSNEEGVFVVDEDIPNNTYIEFYKLGYQSKIIKHKTGQEIKVLLEKLHIELDEISINESFSFLANSKNVNVEKKSLRDNFISSNSLVENIIEIPGLHSIGSGLGIQKIVIRGLSGMRVVTYLNGMKIENQQWANDHGIGFTDLGLYEVELIKGASALKYGGEAVAGVLYFKDAPFVKSEVPSGFLSVKFDNSHLFFGNQFGLKWSKKQFFVNTYGQYNISSDYRLPNNTFLFNSRFRNQAVKLSISRVGKKMQNIFRYQYNAEQLGIPAHSHGNPEDIILDDITLSSIVLPDDFKLSRPSQFVNNHLFIFENNYFSDKTKYSVYFGHFINNLKEYEKWTYPAFDMTLSNTYLKGDMMTRFNYFTINSGGQLQRLTNINNVLATLIPNSIANDFGFYSTLDYDKEKIGLNIGVRLDYKKIYCSDHNYSESFSSFSSSLGLFLKHKSHLLRFTYSSSFRPPHLSELFSNGVHHGTNRYEVGEVNLELEKNYQFDLKYQWSNDHFGIVVNPFSQYIKDFIAINPSDSLYQNIYRIYNYTKFSKVKIAGCEINFHYHPHFLHNLHFEQSYAFLNTKNYDNNTVLALTPANKIKTRINLNLEKQDLPFKLRILSIYYMYVFQQEKVVEYEIPTSSYKLLNLELIFHPVNNINFVFGVNNLLNEEYVPHLSRLKEVGQGIPNPGRSFNLSLKYDF